MSCKHCNLMSDYYSARQAQEERAETYSLGYDSENRDFYENVETRVNFKDFLINQREGRQTW